MFRQRLHLGFKQKAFLVSLWSSWLRKLTSTFLSESERSWPRLSFPLLKYSWTWASPRSIGLMVLFLWPPPTTGTTKGRQGVFTKAQFTEWVSSSRNLTLWFPGTLKFSWESIVVHTTWDMVDVGLLIPSLILQKLVYLSSFRPWEWPLLSLSLLNF